MNELPERFIVASHDEDDVVYIRSDVVKRNIDDIATKLTDSISQRYLVYEEQLAKIESGLNAAQQSAKKQQQRWDALVAICRRLVEADKDDDPHNAIMVFSDIARDASQLLATLEDEWDG